MGAVSGAESTEATLVGSRFADVTLRDDVSLSDGVDDVLTFSAVTSGFSVSDVSANPSATLAMSSEDISGLGIDGGRGGNSIIGLGSFFLGVTTSFSQPAKMPTVARGFGF